MVNIETRFELEKTAEFFAYQVTVTKDNTYIVHPWLDSPANFTAKFSGIEALGNCIRFCNWFFSRIEELDEIENSN